MRSKSKTQRGLNVKGKEDKKAEQNEEGKGEGRERESGTRRRKGRT